MFHGFPCGRRDRLSAAYFDAISAYTRLVNLWNYGSKNDFREVASSAMEARATLQHRRLQLLEHCRDHACDLGSGKSALGVEEER